MLHPPLPNTLRPDTPELKGCRRTSSFDEVLDCSNVTSKGWPRRHVAGEAVIAGNDFGVESNRESQIRRVVDSEVGLERKSHRIREQRPHSNTLDRHPLEVGDQPVCFIDGELVASHLLPDGIAPPQGKADPGRQTRAPTRATAERPPS